MPFISSFSSTGKAKATFPGQAGTPSINSQASGQIGLSWTAPSFSGGAPIIDYRIEYSTDGGSSWSEWSHTPSTSTSALVTGLSDYFTYKFRVSGVNAVGYGQSSSNSNDVLQYNAATGGSVSTISDYNGTGQTWKVHEFTSGGTLTFTRSITPIRAYIGAGNGGGGSSGCCGSCATRASYGGQYTNDSFSVTNQSYSIVVGGGGAGGVWSLAAAQAGAYVGGAAGGSSSFGGVSRSGGAGGPSSGGNYTVSNIRGSGNQNIGFQTWSGNCGDGHNGSNGIAGRVIVAYRIS